jgi:hypothetical protein
VKGYFASEKYLRRRLLFLTFVGVIILFPLALAYAYGLISPRALGWVLLGYVACVTIVVLVILRNVRARFGVSAGTLAEPPDDATRRKDRRRVRILQVGVALFAVVLVFALWDTRDAPWPPRLAGAVINLLMQAGMIASIRRLKKDLKQRTNDQRS